MTMATIIDKPDRMSLSGNMRKFTLGVTGPVSFVLKKGADVLLERSYEPGADKRVTIDVREVVESQLSYALDASKDNYPQNSIAGDFTAIIDKEPHPFRAIRAGVANLADTPGNWLMSHFLTWQPRVKDVTYHSPEWLTYYAMSACSIKVKAVFPDKSSSVIILRDMAANECRTFNLQYAVVARLSGNRYPTHYEVWAEAGGSKLTGSQFYKFSDTLSGDEQWFLFENSLGGLDTFRAYGVSKLQAGHEHLVAELSDSLLEYDVDTERAYTKNTGHLDGYSRRWLLDFFPSRSKYIYETAAIRKIVVTESDASYASNDLPSSYTFTYRMANQSKLLNLIRNEGELPGNLVAPDLSSPDFIFPPRLAELPRVTLSEGVLIPAFDPHGEKSTVTTLGAIKDAIGKGTGEGGDTNIDVIKSAELETRVSTDKRIYSSLSTDIRIQESEEKANKKFLRKDIPDTAAEKITFNKGLLSEGDAKFEANTDFGGFSHGSDSGTGTGGRVQADGAAEFMSMLLRSGMDIGTFIPGLLGCGIRIKDGRIEANELFLRKKLTVPELVYSKIRVVGNEMWVTEGGEVEEVLPDQDSSDNLYWIRLKDTDKNRACGFRENDILRGIVHVRDEEGQFQGFHTVMCRVVSVAKDQAFSVIPQAPDMVPVEGLVFARQGNLTNPDRQRSIYLSSELGCIRFLNDVDGYDILPRMISMQLGTTEGAVIPGLEDLPGYNAILNNVVARGSFVQISGDKVTERPIPCFKGEWKAGKYYYYDEVTKNGCKYLCIAKTTGQQPAYDSTDWLMTEGNNKFSVSLESSMGYEFPAGALDTMLTARVFAGNEEITGMIASSFVKWTRKSGDTDSDTGWNALHEGAGTTIPLTPADIPTSRPDLMVFECEITIVYNDKVHKQSDKIII